MQQDTRLSLILKLENIGPLKQFQIEIKPGINIIKAPNASGKTSLVRGLASMFSNQIPPSHLLSLDEVQGKIVVIYGDKTYVKKLRRTSLGSVTASGTTLPFSDSRAFDACVAMAETSVVHKITGGGTVFREYLEVLSYGKYYSTIISAAQELINDISRELAGPSFERFESIPLLVTELTNLYLRREQVETKIANLKAGREDNAKDVIKKKQETEADLLKEENGLSILKAELHREEEKIKQLKEFLELTDDSAKVTARLRESIASSKKKQKEIRKAIIKKSRHIAYLREEVAKLEKEREEKLSLKSDELKSLEDEVQRLNEAINLKEEAIQQAEKIPDDDPRYGGRLVIEVRKDLANRIEWLNKVVEYYQDKYMRRMASAKLRFNRNINRAFKELMLKGFENIFLDQDFRLNIIRENGVHQPVETLSASEKLTVSLMLMLAAKETFLPDFPFFILDELTLSYDSARFKQILNYVKRHVPYVVVTALTSEERGEPTITYEA
ncbi:AAA family ATPase [Candidatus Bathyarchaeota archaeon]|nr:AAA family ATPase [Candidatus Bathyarchaeota archaeon]